MKSSIIALDLDDANFDNPQFIISFQLTHASVHQISHQSLYTKLIAQFMFLFVYPQQVFFVLKSAKAVDTDCLAAEAAHPAWPLQTSESMHNWYLTAITEMH